MEHNLIDSLVNLNTVLLLLASGLIVWIVRQIIPDRIEKMKVWRIVLRILPVALGAGLACVPQLRPMSSLPQSLVIGGVAGSFSSTLYEVVREALGEKIKAVLGSPQSRRRSSIVPGGQS